MNAETITAVVAIASLLISLLFSAVGIFSGYMLMQMKVQIVTLQLSIAEGRISDAKELREYFNGSFMRSKEAIVRMDSMEARLDIIEDRPSRH